VSYLALYADLIDKQNALMLIVDYEKSTNRRLAFMYPLADKAQSAKPGDTLPLEAEDFVTLKKEFSEHLGSRVALPVSIETLRPIQTEMILDEISRRTWRRLTSDPRFYLTVNLLGYDESGYSAFRKISGRP
jgi:hypothetical protein